MKLTEFDIISQFFSQKNSRRDDVILGIGDDAAIISVPPDQQLVVTMDTLVAGVHFPLDTHPYDIGYKTAAVNLSDLAAMGATPAWATLALTLPEADAEWLKAFSHGLFELLSKYHVQLIGGDLTKGPLTLTLQAHGFTPAGKALTRRGAKPGDLIFVSGTLGDAALGLQIAQKKISIEPHLAQYAINRLNRPEPRVELGIALRDKAHAAIDISDGLTADLQHILTLSNVGAKLDVEKIPLSPALKSLPFESALSLALSGGDDYELCVTVPPHLQNALPNTLTLIGVITENLGLNGIPTKGYQHF